MSKLKREIRYYVHSCIVCILITYTPLPATLARLTCRTCDGTMGKQLEKEIFWKFEKPKRGHRKKITQIFWGQLCTIYIAAILFLHFSSIHILWWRLLVWLSFDGFNCNATKRPMEGGCGRSMMFFPTTYVVPPRVWVLYKYKDQVAKLMGSSSSSLPEICSGKFWF